MGASRWAAWWIRCILGEWQLEFPQQQTSSFPASLMTPLSVSVTPAFSSSHHYIQSFSEQANSPAFSFTDSRKCHTTYSPTSGLDSVSHHRLIHSNLNVITSSSTVIQKVANGFLASNEPSQAASGPLTRSRKRRLFEEDNGEKILEKHHHLGKTKVQRAGTIVIE